PLALHHLPSFPTRRSSDLEGFSHLFVLWVFHKAEGFDLEGTPPSDNRPHGLFATRSPRRPNPIGLSVVELLRREGSRLSLRRVEDRKSTRLNSSHDQISYA